MKVLAIIDMQKDFIDGALGTKEAIAIVPKVAARLAHTSSRYYTGHCTGAHAFEVLRETFGERISLLAAGSVIEL